MDLDSMSSSSVVPTTYCNLGSDIAVEVKIEMDEKETLTGGDTEDYLLGNDKVVNSDISEVEKYLQQKNLVEEGEYQDNNVTLVDPVETALEVSPSSVDFVVTTTGEGETLPHPPQTSRHMVVNPSPKFTNKKQFTSEMEANIQDIVNECVSVLQLDPREYHPFYLRVYKYTLIGKKMGFIKSEKEVDSLWQKYDKFAKSQFEKWKSEGGLHFNNEYSPYLNYILTKKVIINGYVIPLKHCKKERNDAFKKVDSTIKSLYKKWTQDVCPDQEIRDNLKYRLEFFECVKHITYPGDTVTVNKHWTALVNGFPKIVPEKECKANGPVSVKRSTRERKRPARFEPTINFSTETLKSIEETEAKRRVLVAVDAVVNEVKEGDANMVTGDSAREERIKMEDKVVENDEPKRKRRKREKPMLDGISLPCSTQRALDGGQCPYCPKYMKWRLQRHILEVHNTQKKNKPRADLKNMTEEEKRDFRKKWAKKYRREMTPEEAEEVKRYHREKRLQKLASMTPEARNDFKLKRRFYEMQRRLKNQDLSEEEKERRRTINYVKKQAYLASKPREWLQEKEEKRRKRVKEKVELLTDEQKEERRRKHRDYVHNLTGEKLQRHKESMRRGLQKYLNRLKKEDPQEYWNKTTGLLKRRWKDWLKYQRQRVQNETPMEREARLLRYRINQAKRKEKKRLEQQGASQDEINTRLKIAEEFVRSQPKPPTTSVYKPRKGARKPHNVPNAKLRPANWDHDVGTSTEQLQQNSRKQYSGRKRGRPRKEASLQQKIDIVPTPSPPPPPPPPQPLVTILTPFRQVTLPMVHSQQHPSHLQLQQPIITLVQPASITFQVISSSTGVPTSQETFEIDGSIHHISQNLSCGGNNDIIGDSSNYPTNQLTQYSNASFVETSVPVTMVSTDSTILFSPMITTTTIQMSDLFTTSASALDEAQIVELEIPIETELIVKTDDNVFVEPDHEPEPESEIEHGPETEHDPEPVVVVEQKSCPPSRQAGICDECGKSFTTTFSLQLHKHIAHPADPSILICPKCQVSCTSTVTLWNHFVAYHLEDVDAFPEEHFPKKVLPPRSKTEPYVQKRFDPNIINNCEQCGKKFVQKCTLDDHVRRVHEGRGHYCDLCGRDQQSAAKLWRHKVERHNMTDLAPPEGVPAVTCKYCGEIVMRGYEKHVQKRHPEQIEDFQQWYIPELGTAPKQHIPPTKVKCPQCPSILSSKLLNRHIKQIHMDRPRHPCPECGFMFKRLDHMRKHYRDQHALAGIEKRLEAKQFIKVINNKRNFFAVCLLCQMELSARPTVRAHFVQAHLEIFEQCQVTSLPIFDCQVCEEKFAKEMQLKSHMETTHPDKLYPCQHCGIFKYSDEELKKHEINHQRNELIRKKRRGICRICDFDCRANISINTPGVVVGLIDMSTFLRQHVKSEHPDKFLPCPNENCLKYGTNPEDFRNHLAKCQKQGDGILKRKQFVDEKVGRLWVHCPECRVSIRLYLLEKHLSAAHQKQQNNKFVCEHCVGLVFKKQKFYVAHMHQVHQVSFEELLDLAPERTFKLKTRGRSRGNELLSLTSKRKGRSKRSGQEFSEDEEAELRESDNQEEDIDWKEDDNMENNISLNCSRKSTRRTINKLKKGNPPKLGKMKSGQQKSRRGRKPKLPKKDVLAEQYADLEREKKLVIRVERMSDDLMNFYLARQIIKVEPED